MKRLTGIAIFFCCTAAFAAGPTFSKDIAPVFYKNCVSCHRPGEIAPMSLLTYKDARPWAKTIREKVAAREMPPWHAAPEHGKWTNDRRIPAADIAKIVAWVDAGSPEGNPKDMPAAPTFANGWQIGKPDVVFYMPTEYAVPAEGVVAYQNFSVPTNFKEDMYVQAMEARAGDLSVVHHIVMYVREPNAPVKRGNPKNGPDLGNGLLGALSPGQTPFIAEPGKAKLIKAGANLVFQMHYTPNGKATKDRSMVGLIFSKAPVDQVVTTTGAFNLRFSIPPGADNQEVRATYEFDEDSHIVSFSPHMHLRGKDFEYRATYPDGRTEVLLSVPKYDFAWQVYYYPEKDLAMPKGSKLECIAHFDNSTKNKRNPDATREIHFGEQTWDEMMNGFFDYTIDNQHLAKQATGGSK